MAQLKFNNAVINGTTVSKAMLVGGSGKITISSYVDGVTTLNHVIHVGKIDEKGEAEFEVYGNYVSLASQATTTDMNNFGGSHKFYLDNTKITEFEGLVNAVYDPERRTTKLNIIGEYHGYTG